jgi:hypothetical protein
MPRSPSSHLGVSGGEVQGGRSTRRLLAASLSSPVTVTSSRRNTVALIYYLAALALILVGAGLWAGGHGNGDPYLTLGVVLALAPFVVRWVLALVRRN